MTAFVVVNPKAAGGRAGRDWPRIRAGLESLFPLMSVAQSRARGEAARLVRAALREGHLDVIAVGGDGTINEAVNGFFDGGMPVSPDAVFGFVACGRNSDFRRTFGIRAGYEAGVARLKLARIRKLDIGFVSCLTPRGEPVGRYFVNAASFGLPGRLAAKINHAHLSRLLGQRLSFALGALGAFAGWRAPRVRLIAPQAGHRTESYDEVAGITAVAVANGRWFGGGIKIAPAAEPGDGLFDVVVVGGVARRQVPGLFKALRAGRAGEEPGLRTLRATRLMAAPTMDTRGAVAVETDGESVGLLPATFEILPGAINLRC